MENNIDDILDGKLFSINRFFNEMPVRIINTTEYPIFYASEITEILDLCTKGNSWKTLRRYLDVDHYVSNDELDELGLKKYRANGKTCSNIVMINLQGVYALITVSKIKQAVEFRRFVHDTLNQIRGIQHDRTGYSIDVVNEQELIKHGGHLNLIKSLKNDSKIYKRLLDRVYVFRITRNVTKISDNNSLFHEYDHMTSDDEEYNYEADDDSNDENTIDNYEAFKSAFPDIANDRKYCYKLTKNPSDHDYKQYKYLYDIYVRSSDEFISFVADALSSFKAGKDGSNIYMCDWEKIKNTIDGIAKVDDAETTNIDIIQ